MEAMLGPETELVDCQEAGLARYLREVGRCRLLDRGEEMRLLKRARRGDRKALNDLVTGNLKRVVAVSAEYADRGLPMPDLIAEGNLGLIRAVVGFDPNQAFGFTAYALWWIRRGMESALSESFRDRENGERREPVAAAPEAPSGGAARNPPSPPVRRALAGVREPGRTVIMLYFGFEARRPLSLDRIARLLRIHPRHARHLKDQALRRLHGALPDPGCA